MGKIVAIHSFRGGVGKSNITANLAACLAQQGKRVAVVDLDIMSPGIHQLFGLQGAEITHTLNDYLLEGQPIDSIVYDVGDCGAESVLPPCGAAGGALMLVPASMKLGQISQILKHGYNVTLMSSGMRQLMRALRLDYLFLDTHPGLNEETLFSFTISDLVFIILRPDSQDYEGTSLALEATRRLNVPVGLIVNNIPPSLDPGEVGNGIKDAYATPVVATIPHTTRLMDLGSSGLLYVRDPEHAFSRCIAAIAESVLHETWARP